MPPDTRERSGLTDVIMLDATFSNQVDLLSIAVIAWTWTTFQNDLVVFVVKYGT
jgi:hypothetical protein